MSLDIADFRTVHETICALSRVRTDVRNRVIPFARQVVFDNDFAVLLPYWHKLNALSYDLSRLIPNVMQRGLSGR